MRDTLSGNTYTRCVHAPGTDLEHEKPLKKITA